jgi:hypothetical protein
MNGRKRNLIFRLVVAWGVALIGTFIVGLVAWISGDRDFFIIYSFAFLGGIGCTFTSTAFYRYYLEGQLK